MAVTDRELKQILDENHQALAVYTTGQGVTEAIVLVIDENHAHAGDHIAASFHAISMSVRYAQNFAVQQLRDPEETVDLPEPDHDA